MGIGHADMWRKVVTMHTPELEFEIKRMQIQTRTQSHGYGKVCVFIMNVENYNLMSSTENTPPDSTVSPPP